jgi:hypothetical protein
MDGVSRLLQHPGQGIDPLPLHLPLFWSGDEKSLVNDPFLRPQGDRRPGMHLLVQAFSLIEFDDALHGAGL